VEVTSTFPELVYAPAQAADGDDRSQHDPRS